MRTLKTFTFFLMTFVLCLNACSLTGAPTEEENVIDLSGTWTGTLHDAGQDYDFGMTLTISQTADGGVTGEMVLMGEWEDRYSVTGTFDGTTLRIQEPEERYFTAAYAADTLTGHANWSCYDCPDGAWGTFTLSRTSEATGGDGGESSAVLDLTGTWSGTFIETGDNGRTFTMELVVTHTPGAGDFYAELTLEEGGFMEFYLINGQIEGSHVRFNDSGTEVITGYYWGDVIGDQLDGYFSTHRFDDLSDYTATFSVQRP